MKQQICGVIAKAALLASLALAWAASANAQKFSDWSAPVNLGPVVNSELPGGHYMYFNSERPGGCGGSDLYVSHREDVNDDFAWEPPKNLGCAINTIFDESGATFFNDPETDTITLYFTSLNRPDGQGEWDIYASTLRDDGTFGPAVPVVELNSLFRDTRTALRRDGLEMILTSDRPGGSGNGDLWVSTRESTEDPWSTPANLGPIVNTPSSTEPPHFPAMAPP